MHHHRIDGGLLEQHDVAGECLGDIFSAYGMAAIFDDDGFIVIFLHVRQCFRQNAGLFEQGMEDASVMKRVSMLFAPDLLSD